MKSSDKTKLIIAVAVLVIAGAVFAWRAGLFGGGGSTTPETPVEAPRAGGPRAAPGTK